MGRTLRAEETPGEQTQKQVGSRHLQRGKGEPFISTLWEQSGNGSEPHTESGFRRSPKNKRKKKKKR